MNSLLHNARPQREENSITQNSEVYQNPDISYDSVVFEFFGPDPKETANGRYASTPKHNRTAPGIFFASSPSQFSAPSQFTFEPPKQPSQYDYCENRFEGVFQNLTNESVPPLESATPLSSNDIFNRRLDFETAVIL